MSEREYKAEIVCSGTWLYDDQVPTDVWIVKQNFEYHYEPDFPAGPERLNDDGETFQVVFARNDSLMSLGPDRFSQQDAIAAAEQLISSGINWTNHAQHKPRGGRYSLLLAD